MNNNSQTFRTDNERLLLINILNTMYNDNLRQINNLNETLNNLNNTNNQIRNLLVQILENSTTTNLTRNNFYDRTVDRRNQEINERNNNNHNNNSNRIYLNNRPYVIDSITEYNIPSNYLNRNNIIRNNIDISELSNIINNFMQPVEVYPTQSQIESATRRVRYCDISRPAYNQCPISLEEFNDNDMVTVIRPCGHIFHTDPLMNWFRSNSRCPICRFDIREYASNASTEIFNNDSQNNIANLQTPIQRTDNTDVSNNNNNNRERNNPSTSSINILNDFFDIDSVVGTNDLSGNRLDNMFGGTTTFLYLLNAMNNRSRNSR